MCPIEVLEIANSMRYFTPITRVLCWDVFIQFRNKG